MLAAVMVVSLTPPKSNAPIAVSATTLPALTSQLRGSATQDANQVATDRNDEQVRIGRIMMSRDNAPALVGSPNAVSAAPADPEALVVGQREPDDGERVYVLTTTHTYVVRWWQIDRVEAPDGSAVVNADGELLARFGDGEIDILVE